MTNILTKLRSAGDRPFIGSKSRKLRRLKVWNKIWTAVARLSGMVDSPVVYSAAFYADICRITSEKMIYDSCQIAKNHITLVKKFALRQL